ncbi:aminodeoxychorismate lyase [Bordetella sp. J329]|jgi:UPF0755 protein|uniref:endolytic transglycosylase MltG n=1 Tax=Kerstersia gyiorum TaxID=206506 RepID=UPI000FD8EE68|nr:endolytic transglycosylase MltG [Kerstersia gyiorum]AZV93770.1 aminodeoxychorismate lyase [Bordetella sp. J329]MCH4272815.1 endolytic transglycosylase MltG [Kerstersia gyiorum]MCI1230443.1 endolytic transglycosylase MltG [Kerstersia gyiorum]
MKYLRLFLLWVLLPAVLLAALAGGTAWYWTTHPITMQQDKTDFVVSPGSTPRTIAMTLQEQGVEIDPRAFAWLARYRGDDVRIKAGGYEALRGDTPLTLLERLAGGVMSQRQLTFVEGWNYAQIRAALRAHPDVRQTLDGVGDKELLERLGSNFEAPEGLFFPDTYIFSPGTTDFDILAQAYRAQIRELEQAWAQRSAGLPIKSPYELLILASIIEKETGHHEDRGKVGGVFVNRLRVNMPLQTDPTVIYGMGDRYQGRIRKRDLEADTPWNTYTRRGLPPTPIASPGRASLQAAVAPDEHGYYYFVSRGDGSSAFAATLAEHNRNVARFILNR